MQKYLKVLALVMLTAACGQDETATQPMSESETAALQAESYNFFVFPKATLQPAQGDTLRRAHFVLQPEAKEAPAMAVYDTDASLDEVVKFYSDKYSYETIAPNGNGTPKPVAYFTSGDIAADTAQIKPILDKLGMKPDIAKAVGQYRGAYLSSKTDMPRVSIQRPYFDAVKGELVDKTLIVLVRE